VSDDDIEVVDILKSNLDYFDQLLNDDNNEIGWTPLSLAAKNNNIKLC
jgi:ankyrin repeat protein